MSSNPYRGWVYAELGDYHRNLDPNWSYTPTYLRKMKHVRNYISHLPQEATIIDIGCGEGVIVEEFRSLGRNIEGIDLNYESDYVRRGSVLALPYADSSIDAALFLDTLEHLAYADQTMALHEIYRVLKPEGSLFISIPNLAHFNSRLSFLIQGRLDRSDVETDHVGERPLWENLKLLIKAKFDVEAQIGVTLTLPLLYRRVICRAPARFKWLHDLQEPLAARLPSLSLLTLMHCKKA